MDNLNSQFLLRDDICFLNFGSFGACPIPVFKRYQDYQLELEQGPVQFITVTGPQYLESSRKALAQYLNCNDKDLVYVTNPSYAVNIIAKSFNLKPGDEILTTNLEYGACDKTWEYYCKKAGAIYKKQEIKFPIKSKEDFIEQFFKGASAKTKMVYISHITSSTGLRLPIEEICAVAKEKGWLTFVDGAHGPGQVPVDLAKLPVDIYTGACHKWMLTPKGSSFLYVKKEYQSLFDPLVVSWGYDAMFPSDSKFLDYHQTQGTRDFSAFLTIPAAIEFMQQNNWQAVSESCKKLTRENALRLCNLLNLEPIAPITEDFTAQLFSAQINTTEPEKLKAHLFEDYKIEVPVMRHGNNNYLRYSINAFNSQNDLDKLFEAIESIKAKTNLIET